MGRRRAILMTAQEKIASGLAYEDVKVHFRARIPNANVVTRVIGIPPLPEEIDDETEINTRSYIGHEVGHLKYESKPWPPALLKDKVLKELAFHLEDCRTDRKMGEEFPGVKEDRRAGFALVRDKLPAENVLQTAFFVLYEQVKEYHTLPDSAMYWTQRLGNPQAFMVLQQMMVAVEKQIEQAKRSTGSDDVIRISGEIKEIWKQMFKSGSGQEGGENGEPDEQSKMNDGGMFGEKKEQQEGEGKGDQKQSSKSKAAKDGEDGQPGTAGDLDPEDWNEDDEDQSGGGSQSDEDDEDESGNDGDKDESEDGESEDESEGDESEDGEDSESGDSDDDGDEEGDEDEGSSEGDESDDEDDESEDGEGSKSDDECDEDEEGDSEGSESEDDESDDEGDESETSSDDEGDEDDESESASGEDESEDEDDATGKEKEDEKSDADVEKEMEDMMDDFKSVSETEEDELEARLCDDKDASDYDYGECPEGYRPYTGCDRIEEIAAKSAPASFRSDVKAKLGVMQRRLMMDLMSKRRIWVSDREHGEIDDTRLHRVPTGDKLVYKRKLRRPKLNIAVQLVLDLSSSMQYSGRIFLCGQLGYILGETLSLVRVPFETVGFTTGYGGTNHSEPPVKGVYYHRTIPLRLVVIKPFDMTRRSDMVDRYYAAATFHGSGTVEGEAVWWAAKRLATRPEQRKLLIVVCDGGPCGSPAPTPKFEEHAGQVVRRIRQAGIETIHVGIQTSDPLHYVPEETFVRYDGLQDLLTGFYAQLGAVLRGEKRRNADPASV